MPILEIPTDFNWSKTKTKSPCSDFSSARRTIEISGFLFYSISMRFLKESFGIFSCST